MKKIAILLVFPLMAAAPEGFVHWSAATIKEHGKKLATQVNELKVATQGLNNFGNHLAMLAHRQGDGEAEVHEKQVDFFVVQEGQATLVVGGTLENSRTIGPGEFRAKGIREGTKQKLAPGDIVHIPANTPHQLLVPAGSKFTYFVIKVDSPR